MLPEIFISMTNQLGAVVAQQPFGGARASGTNDKAPRLNLYRWVSREPLKKILTHL